MLLNIFLSWVLSLACLQQAHSTLYQEPLDVEELMRLFDDDDCIVGTLSTMEAEEPMFKFLSLETVSSLQEKVSDPEKKSPLSSVHELASFNNITYQYNLIEEHGPSHNKRFVIDLSMGNEKYQAEGRSIKKAQQEAARLAMNSTLYKHPPENTKSENPQILKKTSEQKLSDWINKHSDTKATYYYSTHSKNVPRYSIDFYHAKEESIHRVTLHINEEQFIGEGLSASIAKENAAKEALTNMHKVHGLCMFSDDERGLLTKLFSDEQSPVSLVNEFASKSHLKLSFDLVGEEGPAHMKNFFYKCTIGSLESYGEGNNKKAAKREAAEKMLGLLKQQSAGNSKSCTVLSKNKKSKSKKSSNLIKSDVKTYNVEEENHNDFSVPEKLDPVSKLYQIQQKTRGFDPIFSITGKENNFNVEVTVGDLSFIGSGSNKKAAKKSAAQGILTKMGYSTDDSQINRPNSSKTKRTSFHRIQRLKSKPIGAGLQFNSENLFKSVKDDYNQPDQIKPKSPTLNKVDRLNTLEKTQPGSKPDKKSPLKPKVQLAKLSQQLGFRFQFSDFPKGKSSGFISLLSLSTDPAKVCYGVGDEIEVSQEKAALSALENIYKTELDSISQILRASEDTQVGEKPTEKHKIVKVLQGVQIEKE